MLSPVPPDALILLAHGSPDPAWIVPIEAIAARIRGAVPPGYPVVVAVLEHGKALAEAVRDLRDARHRVIAIVPVFLSDGGRHLRRDIPAMVTALRQTFSSVALLLAPALGTDAAVQDALAEAAVRHAGLTAGD